MKKIFTIILAVLLLNGVTELHQFLKLPLLLNHFLHHRMEDPSISFWSFIKLHYFDPIVVDDDYQRDQQLPFRDTDCCIVTTASVCECLQVSVEIQPLSEQSKEFHLFNEINKPQFTSFDIFQPPRCAPNDMI